MKPNWSSAVPKFESLIAQRVSSHETAPDSERRPHAAVFTADDDFDFVSGPAAASAEGKKPLKWRPVTGGQIVSLQLFSGVVFFGCFPTFMAKPTVIPVKANLMLVCIHKHDTGVWIGLCDPLGITLEADSHGELVDMFTEAVGAMLRSLWQSGDLDAFMASKGWRLLQPPPTTRRAQVTFDVPFNTRRAPLRDLQAVPA